MKSRQDKHRKALKRGEYEKTGGGYEYRWREKIGYDENGKTKYKQRSITAHSLEELREAELQVIRDKADGLHPKPPQNLNTYVDRWFKVKRGLKDNTLQNYRYMYDKFIRNSPLGAMPLYRLKKSDIISFYTKLVDAGSVSVSTCETLQNVICPALTLAEDDDVIRRNPCRGALKELKKEAKLKQADARARGVRSVESLTLGEQRRFLEYISQDQWKQWQPVFTIALLTGMRVGELCGLTWNNIDYKHYIIHVTQTLVYYKQADGHCRLGVHSTKTVAGTRDLPLNTTIVQMLDLQKRLTAGRSCCDVDGVKDFVFFTREGRPHKQDTLNRALKRIVSHANDEAGTDDVLLPSRLHMHMLRKTYATNLCRSGCDLERLSKMLGHSDIQVSHQTYIQCMADIAADTDAAMTKTLTEAGILGFAANNSSEQNDTPEQPENGASAGDVSK